MSDKISKGNYGEQLATDFLVNAGFEILERNFRYKRAEIDIIARKDDVLVFAEVKARSSQNFGFPEAFVNEAKEEKIREAAEQFIEANNWKGDIRFDIVSVILKPRVEIEHLPDAFI